MNRPYKIFSFPLAGGEFCRKQLVWKRCLGDDNASMPFYRDILAANLATPLNILA